MQTFCTLHVFSYVFLFQSPQVVEWDLKSITLVMLAVHEHVPAIICSWTAPHVTALICVALLHLWLLLCANNKLCWKLKIFDISYFMRIYIYNVTYRYMYTHITHIYIIYMHICICNVVYIRIIRVYLYIYTYMYIYTYNIHYIYTYNDF